TDEVGFGGKMIVDATTKWKEEGYPREWPELIRMDPEVKRKIDEIWDRLGIN
ncbi:MAG TPA: menaquinone biosynthesis decarboxylase, partial [Aquifex aeolicus]|nr:menaquinone biosynthesis decarboxylase [Aquifex aeolicus]